MNPGAGGESRGWQAAGEGVVTRALCPCSHWGLGREVRGGGVPGQEVLPAGVSLAEKGSSPVCLLRGPPSGDVDGCLLRVRTTACPALPFTGKPPEDGWPPSSPQLDFHTWTLWGVSAPTLWLTAA